MNNSPDVIEAINQLPGQGGGREDGLRLRDVAHVHDGYQIQTNYVSQNGTPGG
jgi:multidrug efflux pump subunit AcrB